MLTRLLGWKKEREQDDEEDEGLRMSEDQKKRLGVLLGLKADRPLGALRHFAMRHLEAYSSVSWGIITAERAQGMHMQAVVVTSLCWQRRPRL